MSDQAPTSSPRPAAKPDPVLETLMQIDKFQRPPSDEQIASLRSFLKANDVTIDEKQGWSEELDGALQAYLIANELKINDPAVQELATYIVDNGGIGGGANGAEHEDGQVQGSTRGFNPPPAKTPITPPVDVENVHKPDCGTSIQGVGPITRNCGRGI